jgi:septal ring factor EnvC (AmiA/AmiB activator)
MYLKFISAVMAAAAFAGVLTLLWATNTWIDARAREAAPQSTPVTPTAPALAEAAISPEFVRLEVAGDLAVIRNSVEQLAAKQEQMAQTIATLQAAEQQASEQQAAKQQAAEQDIIQTRSSPPLSEQVSPPPRKKARRVAPRKLAAQSSSVPPPAFRPQ